MTKYWTKPRIRARLIELAETNQALNCESLKTNHCDLYMATRIHYKNEGGLNGALKDAGYDPEKIRKKEIWNPEKIKERIKKLYLAGVSLYFKDAQQVDPRLVQATSRSYGWYNTLDNIGINSSKFRKRLRWNNWNKLTVLSRAINYGLCGIPLNTYIFARKDPAFDAAVRRYYGSWDVLRKLDPVIKYAPLPRNKKRDDKIDKIFDLFLSLEKRFDLSKGVGLEMIAKSMHVCKDIPRYRRLIAMTTSIRFLNLRINPEEARIIYNHTFYPRAGVSFEEWWFKQQKIQRSLHS